MFILSNIIHDMTVWDDQPINDHLDLIEKREGVAWLAELADHIADNITKQHTAEDIEGIEYDICKAGLQAYLAGRQSYCENK